MGGSVLLDDPHLAGGGLLAGEDLVDLALAPALPGDPLQFVGDGLAFGLVPGQCLGDGLRLPECVGERPGVQDRGVGALALVVARLAPSGAGGLAWLWVAMGVGFMGTRCLTLWWRQRTDKWLVTGA